MDFQLPNFIILYGTDFIIVGYLSKKTDESSPKSDESDNLTLVGEPCTQRWRFSYYFNLI